MNQKRSRCKCSHSKLSLIRSLSFICKLADWTATSLHLSSIAAALTCLLRTNTFCFYRVNNILKEQLRFLIAQFKLAPDLLNLEVIAFFIYLWLFLLFTKFSPQGSVSGTFVINQQRLNPPSKKDQSLILRCEVCGPENLGPESSS